MTDRAFVLGLDGVPWRLIDRWTDEGHLPAFARLRREGAAGPFESTIPATTPVAWPSIATGVRPDGHGLYGFRRLTSDYSHRMNTSADVDAPRLWGMVSSAVVANVPMTYPATAVDGTMVAGMMAPEIDEGFTHPPEFAATLRREIPDYRISLSWGEYAGDLDRFLSDFDGLVRSRRDLMELLLERGDDPELFFFVYTAPDRLQHLFWNEDVVREHYRDLDAILDDVMAHVEGVDGTLYVVSDHGFGPLERRVHVNRLLSDAGFLAETDSSGTRGLLDRIGLDRSAVERALAGIGLDEDRIVSLLPRVLVDSVAERLPGDHVLYDVDFDETVAFMHLANEVYVNDAARFDAGAVDPADVPGMKTAVAETLETARDPETGERPLAVHDGADLFPTDDFAPDLVVSAANTYSVNNSLGASAFEPHENKAAGHRSEGIFLAWGPSISAGADPEAATVYDLAPTVLHGLGRPVPDGADGRVLTEIFAEGSRAAETPVRTESYADRARTTAVDREFDAVEDRLRDLGYMD